MYTRFHMCRSVIYQTDIYIIYIYTLPISRLTLFMGGEVFHQMIVILVIVTSTLDGVSTPTTLSTSRSSSVLILEEDGQQLEYHLIGEWYVLYEEWNTKVVQPKTYVVVRSICRNFEKGFPLQISDCYIRVVYVA